MSIGSRAGKIEAVTTTLTNTIVKKIGVTSGSRSAVILSNENASDNIYYAFGTSTSVIADYTAANMFLLRADSDLYFTDAIATGPLFVLQSSGGNLDIKTHLI